MFNSHIAELRRLKNYRQQEHQHHEAEVRKRYHTQIQPVLLEHYNKRLKSFIHKMRENPIILNPENLLPIIHETARFTFKDAQDWNSIRPQRQRNENLQHQRFMSRRKTVQRLQTQEEASLGPHQFRSRDKSLQLHPPMRYKTTEHAEDAPPRYRKRIIKDNSKKKQQTRATSKMDRRDRRGSTKESAVSMSNNSNRNMDAQDTEFNVNPRSQTDNIQIEARLYEKNKEPDEKKMHFKKLADMAITSHDDYQKKDLRQLLRKTGFAKVKRVTLHETVQPDYFTALVQRVTIK